MHENEFIKTAKILHPFALKGKIKIFSFMYPKNSIFNIKPLYIEKKSIEIKYEGDYKKLFIISINNIDDINEIEKFKNKYIYTKKTSFPKLENNNYYWFQLIGMKVINEQNKYCGIIDNIFHNGIYETLIIKKDNYEKLIPFIYKEYIISVDINEKRIVIKNYN